MLNVELVYLILENTRKCTKMGQAKKCASNMLISEQEYQ